MKTVFVLVGACFLALAAGLICHKSSNKYSHFWAGVCAVIGILLASATRLKNGLTYRIEAGRPILSCSNHSPQFIEGAES